MVAVVATSGDGSSSLAPPSVKRKKGGAFGVLGLSEPVCMAITKCGYKQPTPIQRKGIPPILKGMDVIAMSRTGSGKTVAFLAPIVHLLSSHRSCSVGSRALILSPTRELALQLFGVARKFTKFTDLRSCLVVGGSSMENQFEHLSRNPDIIVATPG
eukprot:GHVS01051074.1.p1 GENE.GHVS01051074.1~~GHVS01051074.1.p1  ORF type:complete len:157 (-),score=34.19 GHVS01051074.1:78-548(-)